MLAKMELHNNKNSVSKKDVSIILKLAELKGLDHRGRSFSLKINFSNDLKIMIFTF